MICCKKTANSPEYSIPEWAQTVKPHELTFYRHHLESLNKSLYGISAIARTLHHMETMNACDPGAPDWWDGNLSGGLLTALEQLAGGANEPLGFMIERAAKFDPENDRPTND